MNIRLILYKCVSSNMNILTIKDIRTMIDIFLDLPTMNNFLLTCKFKGYGYKRKYSTYVRLMLKLKKRQCKKHWNFHYKMPDEIVNINCVSLIRTWNWNDLRIRRHLNKLEKNGFLWEQTINKWKVYRKNKCEYDIMISGNHPQLGRVQYWRHDPAYTQSGQSWLIWYEQNKRKCMKVYKYMVKCDKNYYKCSIVSSTSVHKELHHYYYPDLLKLGCYNSYI